MGFDPAKNMHYMKKTSSKICLELHFVQKNPRALMSISPTSELGALKISMSEIL